MTHPHRFSTVTHIWFDIDDTIVDFTANSRATLHIIYRIARLDRYFNDPQHWITTYEFHNRNLWEHYNRALIDSATLRIDRFTLPLIDRGVDRGTATDIARRLDPLYLDILAGQPATIPSAVQVITTLHSRGYTIGALSNGFTGVQNKKLHTAGIHHLFSHIILSDAVGYNKPHPRIFAAAMQAARNTTPHTHLMVGDNPTTDIAGAVAAGWQAAHLDPARLAVDTFRHNTIRIDTLDQLLPLLPGPRPLSH